MTAPLPDGTHPTVHSLFRYPGGKSWFTPFLLRYLDAHPTGLFVEPFAGGASLSAAVLTHTRADVWLNELDEDVAAVHEVTFGDQAPALARRILDFDLTLDAAQAVLNSDPRSTLDRAFRTILKNRVNRGGILAPRAGLVRLGENGRGLKQRWYAQTLADRIGALHAARHRVRVTRLDALTLLEQTPFPSGAALFIDPPYTAGHKSAGRRLYRHHQLDHARLFRACAALTAPWLMTHEHDETVMALAWTHHLPWRTVTMTSGHNVTARELVVAPDFAWAQHLPDLRDAPTPTAPSLYGPLFRMHPPHASPGASAAPLPDTGRG